MVLIIEDWESNWKSEKLQILIWEAGAKNGSKSNNQKAESSIIGDNAIIDWIIDAVFQLNDFAQEESKPPANGK